MKLSRSIKPISYLKSHTAEAIRGVAQGNTMVITLHGEARAVLQDITEYEQTQETIALLKMLAQSTRSLEFGRRKTVKQAFGDVCKQVKGQAE